MGLSVDLSAVALAKAEALAETEALAKADGGVSELAS